MTRYKTITAPEGIEFAEGDELIHSETGATQVWTGSEWVAKEAEPEAEVEEHDEGKKGKKAKGKKAHDDGE
jgi:hypothetical protein